MLHLALKCSWQVGTKDICIDIFIKSWERSLIPIYGTPSSTFHTLKC